MHKFDSDDFFTTKPFYFQEYFIGKFYDPALVVENIQVFIEFSEAHPSIIKGYIIGNSEQYKQLEKISISALTFESYDFGEGNYRAKSSNFVFERISTRGYPDSIQTHMHFVIGNITFFDIEISMSLDKIEKKKSICFYVDASYDELGGKIFWRKKYDGSVELKNTKIQLKISECKPYELSASARYKYYFDKLESIEHKVSTGVIEIEVPSDREISEVDFIKYSKETVDDLLSLYSFANEKNIDWFLYEYFDGLSFKKYAKSFIHKKIQSGELEEYPILLINRNDRVEFVERAYVKFRKLREKGLNLKISIRDLNIGKAMKVLNDQFTLFFLGIEKIVDAFRRKKGREYIIKKKIFSKMQRKIKLCVEGIFKDLSDDESDDMKIKLSQMIKKIPELNRPPLKDFLLEIFEKLKFDLHHIYPKDAEFTLLKTRNQLFHTSMEPEINFLWKETVRAKVVLENLVGRMLECEEYIYSPKSWERNSLTKEEK
jgi:hypothetical protein